MITLNNIREQFTLIANEYTKKGYTFSITMSGHQGELMKVDLTNGKETIRIRLDREDAGKELMYASIHVIVVEKFDKSLNDIWTTLWNGKGELVDKIEYYPIDKYDKNIFTTDIEEYKAVQELRLARFHATNIKETKSYTSDKAKQIALNFVHKQPKCKTKKIKDIDSVVRGKGYFRIITTGKDYYLYTK